MRIILKFIFLGLLLLLPITLFSQIGFVDNIYQKIIVNQIVTTVVIITSVVISSVSIGTLLSWIFAMYNFPLKNILEKIVILGMVFPSYALAFFYSEAFKIEGKMALIETLTISSIPYVFMMVTIALRSQSHQMIDTALMFGKNEHWIKLKIILPVLIPPVILSTLLVVGDTFSEFGATYFYGVNTVMTGIYEIWFGLHENIQGIRLTSWLFLSILTVYFFVNHWKTSLLSYNNNAPKVTEYLKPESLGYSKYFLTLSVLIYATFSFFVPMGVLTSWVFETYHLTDWLKVITVTFNSVLLATTIAFSIISISTMLLYLFKKNMLFLLTVCNSQYAVPGIVLSITAIYLIDIFDTKLLLVGFIFVLIMKYLALGVDGISISLRQIPRQYYYIAKSYGKNSMWYVKNIQIPLSKQCYVATFILIWIDVIRELVIGLTIRPQWLHLLSIEIFRFMDLEMLSMSGPWILSMVVVTIIPIFWLNSMIKLKVGDNNAAS
jgi:iron(III) transport system permease protein